jgi:hypothetical protein
VKELARKVCTSCNAKKPLTDFHAVRRGKDGKRSRCRVCIGAEGAVYRAANKNKESARNAAYTAAGRHRCDHDKVRNSCFVCRPKAATAAAIRGAEVRGFFWGLTDEQAIFIATQPCVYCNKTPANGIDRQKNEYGYTPLNSVPCCGEHNRMKGTMPQKGFILACKAVATHCVSKEDFIARTNKLQQELKEFESWQKNPSN